MIHVNFVIIGDPYVEVYTTELTPCWVTSWMMNGLRTTTTIDTSSLIGFHAWVNSLNFDQVVFNKNCKDSKTYKTKIVLYPS